MFKFIAFSLLYYFEFLLIQVWRAELVLADFMLHMMYNSSDFDGIVGVELGAGTGKVSCA